MRGYDQVWCATRWCAAFTREFEVSTLHRALARVSHHYRSLQSNFALFDTLSLTRISPQPGAEPAHSTLLIFSSVCHCVFILFACCVNHHFSWGWGSGVGGCGVVCGGGGGWRGRRGDGWAWGRYICPRDSPSLLCLCSRVYSRDRV